MKLTRAGLILSLLYLHPLIGLAQDCTTLNFTVTTKESRCMATGSIKVNITGGSGSYNIKVTGPITTAYTSSTNITGLSAGSYVVSVKDINTGCVTDKYDVIVPGSYAEPRFVLTKTDVTCMNGTDGTVTVSNQLGGRSPFVYSIVAPSPSGVGTTNSTGHFTNLIAGEYAIQLKDSCGGQQTRRITILNYQWWIDGITVAKIGCDSAQVTIKIKDSKGNTSNFPGFQYGVVRNTGDTVWSATSPFRFYIGTKRFVKLVVKDPCGTMQVSTWVDPNRPTVNANVTTSGFTCNTFNATVSGQGNLTNPNYELLNSSNVVIATNTTGSFTNLAYGSYCIRVKDNCYDTTITRCFSASQPKPAISNTISISNKACSTFTASITGQTNLTNPVYELYNGSNTLIGTSTDGVFNNIKYGYYCIKVKDGCYDTTITKCFTVNTPLPSADANINPSGIGCNSFTASVTGQSNLTNPQYCLYNSSDVLIGCNATGSFDNLAYNTPYCIRIENDDCYDTTIVRCFNIRKLVPGVGTTVDINKSCSTFTASITGQQNLNNPSYCLYDANDVLITCTPDGIFPNLPYGSYCIRVTNDATCYDTVFKRCFEVLRSKPSLSSTVNISNKGCSTVTAKISGSNLTNAKYVLYNAANVAIDSNTNGTFNNVPYGYHCIRVRPPCYDTLMERCFTAKRDIPSVGSVAISNKACSTFTAKVNGQSNLQSPQYNIYDTLGNFVATGSSNGTFNNLLYGWYDVKVKDPCYDTVITRRINAAPVPIDIAVTAKESCTFGTTDVKVTFNTGNAPYRIEVRNPVGVLVTSVTSATSPIMVNALQPLTGGQQYTVIGIDNCNVRDTALVTPSPSIINKTKFVKSKCPSGVWENGATDIDIDVSSNMGVVTPVIIRKNGNTVTINFTSNVGSTYKFVDLEPSTYIVQYSVPNCTGKIYDTVVVAPYAFPGLQQSAAYQCDNNNFSVGAVVTGGCSPFSYEVIGSIPDTPSIISSGQTSPVFSITNGVQYSLIRLRAVDACGNATLNDVNILPLANTIIYASSDCYYQDVNLHVDSTANATYNWYKKTSETDSVLVSTTTSYRIPYLLPSDIGMYVCHMSVNGGCLTKISYFEVTGMCGGILPGQVKLSGKENNGVVQLNWVAQQDVDTKEYIVERSAGNGQYLAIGAINSRQLSGRSMYAFTDEAPVAGANNYRLRIVSKDNKITYSNIIPVKIATVSSITLYPNPVKRTLNIALTAKQQDSYKLSLFTITGQVVHEQVVQKVQQAKITYHRDAAVKSGMYMLRITALSSQETFTYKVIFE